MPATLQLRFDPSGGQPIAEIGFNSTHGNPTRIALTEPCANFTAFAKEVGVLRKELDKMEKEAKERFSAKSPNYEARENYTQLLKTLGRKNLEKFPRIKRIKK